MACAICKIPVDRHQPALQVLGELPFEVAESVLKHQWHKDITKIMYAHAEYHHDQSLFDNDSKPSHQQQLQAVEADIKRHRSKYIMHYLHAVLEAHRDEEGGATRVTNQQETLMRLTLEKDLDCQLPKDLDAVFRQPKPYAWDGTMIWEQSKQYRDDMQSSIEMAERMFGSGYVQEVIDRRLLMVISIMVRLYSDEESGDGYDMLVPKTPDLMWCWNQTTEHIQEFQHMTKLDLF
ncbi:hypothetical protein GGR51DRAFT_230952 [Nemania sp. FL0031]|nr:hypothetical protein GGR51DRAFT_230952 [Nemania sp. FL0031]